MALLLNTSEAAPLVGKAVEGAVLGAYVFDRYKQEKDEFLAKDAVLTILAHPDLQAEARRSPRGARSRWRRARSRGLLPAVSAMRLSVTDALRRV